MSEEFYTSILEAPFDDLPEGYEDGDNSLLENSLGGIDLDVRVEEVSRLLAGTSAKPIQVIPFARTLKFKFPYYVGKDILAVSRALAKAGVRDWKKRTQFYGKGMANSVSRFQKKVGLKQTGVYDLETHKRLAKYFDAYGAFLMGKMVKNLTAPSPREVIINYATFGYNNRSSIHYTQSYLRMWGVKNKVVPPKIPLYEDCSSFATWCYWGAKVKDPNGFNYNGLGYTGTLANNGVKTTSPKPGDLAFYGRYPYSHVVICLGESKGISHGSERGPLLLNIYYRNDLSHFRTYF